MSAGEGDKRKVSTDALETLGTIIGADEKRDAIHLAVEPVEAGERLKPGEDVLLRNGKAYAQRDSENEKPLGIVDPFLKWGVQAGERFWLVVYPRQIHSLRHVWTHPAFPDEPEVAGMAPKVHKDKRAASEAWLRNWIASADCPDYDTVMKAALGEHVDNEDYGGEAYSIEDYGDGPNIFFRGRDAHSDIPPEFWDHVEIVSGKKPPVRAVGFSCSC
jgi:hypothetical protein